MLIASIASGADNKLSVVKTSPTTASIYLHNTEVIAGLQFSIQSSSNIILQEPYRSGRTLGQEWTVASYKVSDSIINVVIISLQQKYFDAGSGAIIELNFAENGGENSEIRLAGVKAGNPNAEKVELEIQHASWSNSKPLAEELFEFGGSYPNPFNPFTRINYVLKKPAYVTLSVYDVRGREIDRLIDGQQESGMHTATWNSETTSRSLASGVYFARLTVDGISVTHKMVLTK